MKLYVYTHVGACTRIIHIHLRIYVYHTSANECVYVYINEHVYLYMLAADHTSRTTYLPIYRTNIDHERATEPYDMPRLPHGFYSFALVRLFLSFFLFNGTKVDPS